MKERERLDGSSASTAKSDLLRRGGGNEWDVVQTNVAFNCKQGSANIVCVAMDFVLKAKKPVNEDTSEEQNEGGTGGMAFGKTTHRTYGRRVVFFKQYEWKSNWSSMNCVKCESRAWSFLRALPTAPERIRAWR